MLHSLTLIHLQYVFANIYDSCNWCNWCNAMSLTGAKRFSMELPRGPGTLLKLAVHLLDLVQADTSTTSSIKVRLAANASENHWAIVMGQEQSQHLWTITVYDILHFLKMYRLSLTSSEPFHPTQKMDCPGDIGHLLPDTCARNQNKGCSHSPARVRRNSPAVLKVRRAPKITGNKAVIFCPKSSNF